VNSLPELGAMVGWEDMMGHPLEGEVIKITRDENNGQEWVTVQTNKGFLTMVRGGKWTCVVNP
jgi:hypothetical protein